MKRTALKRGKPLRRVVVMTGGKAIGHRQVDKRKILWNAAVRGSICVACRERPATEGHHIVKEQTLRKYARQRGYDFETVRFDTRNRLAVCKRCHANHHSGYRRFSKELLLRFARWVFDFARELDLEWALERDYT